MSRLVLTLYEQTCFTKNYNERLSFDTYETGYSVLEKYLSLTTKEIIELNNTYYENNMEIVVERNILKNPYSKNYAKIEEYDDNDVKILVRYCFVNKIECKNELAYIDLEEDIWNSYADKILGTSVCLLTRSRFKTLDEDNFETLELPIEYNGNNPLFIHTIPNIYTGKVGVIIEIQSYKLGTADEITDRDFSYFVVGSRPSPVQGNYPPVTLPYVSGTISQAVDVINKYIKNMATEMISYYPWESGSKHYEIGNIYIVPSSLIDLTLIDTYYEHDYGITTLGIGSNVFGGRLFKFKKEKYNLLNFVFTSTILNNYKNYSIGTLSNQIPVVNNGTNMDCKISMSFCDNSFSLKMHYNNNIVDITEDFFYDAPYEMLRSEEFYQRKMSLKMKNVEYDYGIFEKMLGAFGYDQNKIVAGVGGAITSKTKFSGIEKAVSGAFDTIKDIVGAFKLNEQKSIANSSMYSATKGLFKNTVHFLNYLNGIVLLSINPDNDYYVKDMVDNFGFKVAKFINYSASFEFLIKHGYNYANQYGYNWNIMKFEGVSVYGDFSCEIAQQLNKILEDGIKIWYDPYMYRFDTATDDLLNT